MSARDRGLTRIDGRVPGATPDATPSRRGDGSDFGPPESKEQLR